MGMVVAKIVGGVPRLSCTVTKRNDARISTFTTSAVKTEVIAAGQRRARAGSGKGRGMGSVAVIGASIVRFGCRQC